MIFTNWINTFLKRFWGWHGFCKNGLLKSQIWVLNNIFRVQGEFQMQSKSSDDFPAVADGTTQDHTEDHSNYHDSSYSNSDISNYVEFAVEEVVNASLTVLCIWFLIRAGIGFGSTTVQYFLVVYQCTIIVLIVFWCVIPLDIFNNLVFIKKSKDTSCHLGSEDDQQTRKKRAQ